MYVFSMTPIGGHGILDGVEVHTPGRGSKNLPAAKGGQNFFSPALPPGGDFTK